MKCRKLVKKILSGEPKLACSMVVQCDEQPTFNLRVWKVKHQPDTKLIEAIFLTKPLAISDKSSSLIKFRFAKLKFQAHSLKAQKHL